MDSFGKIIVFFILAMLLFLVPSYYFALKQDMIVQNYVNKETTDFVNTIKNTGQITKNTYNLFIKKLDVTNNVYDIKMTHQHEIVNPLEGDEPLDNNDDTENKIFEEYYNTYEDDILKELFEGSGVYKLSKDDYITVTVRNRSRTLASRIQNSLGIHGDSVIYVTYGGVIRDEVK